MPPKDSFDPKNMREKKYEEFSRWYDEETERLQANPDQRYCLADEMLAYCISDVDILRMSCQSYRINMKQLFKGADPFDNLTLPAYCNR